MIGVFILIMIKTFEFSNLVAIVTDIATIGGVLVAIVGVYIAYREYSSWEKRIFEEKEISNIEKSLESLLLFENYSQLARSKKKWDKLSSKWRKCDEEFKENELLFKQQFESSKYESYKDLEDDLRKEWTSAYQSYEQKRETFFEDLDIIVLKIKAKSELYLSKKNPGKVRNALETFKKEIKNVFEESDFNENLKKYNKRDLTEKELKEYISLFNKAKEEDYEKPLKDYEERLTKLIKTFRESIS